MVHFSILKLLLRYQNMFKLNTLFTDTVNVSIEMRIFGFQHIGSIKNILPLEILFHHIPNFSFAFQVVNNWMQDRYYH